MTSTTGRNAIHDTADKDMSAAPPTETDLFDAVVFTDVSSTSFKSWHRASALGGEGSGVPEEVRSVGRRSCRFYSFDITLFSLDVRSLYTRSSWPT